MANKANLANSFLAAPVSDTDTTLTVETGDGALFPATPFYATLTEKNKLSRFTNSEIVEVTDVTGDVLTIVRAQRGTSAIEFDTGDIIANGIYVEDFDELANNILETVYPIGSIYTEITGVNPSTTFGFGTWSQFGAGRTLVGLDSEDSDFDTVEETGGTKTETLSTSQIPSHTHKVDPPSTSTNTTGNHNHGVASNLTRFSGGSGEVALANGSYKWMSPTTHSTDGNHSHTVNIAQFDSGSSGGGEAHNNLQPYITVYFWKRTA